MAKAKIPTFEEYLRSKFKEDWEERRKVDTFGRGMMAEADKDPAKLEEWFNRYRQTKGESDLAEYDKLYGTKGGQPVDGADAVAEQQKIAVAPDLTDEVIKKARKRQATLLTMGAGRRSTFLTGALGAPNPRTTFMGGY